MMSRYWQIVIVVVMIELFMWDIHNYYTIYVDFTKLNVK